jgi:hypothetical protein
VIGRVNYIRGLINLGGSTVIALPPYFIRRKRLASGLRMVIVDAADHLELWPLTNEMLEKINLESKQRANLVEVERLTKVSKKVREKHTQPNKTRGAKWE